MGKWFKTCMCVVFSLFSSILLVIGLGGCSSNAKMNTSVIQEDTCWDVYPDTWVATDALGRKMPDFNEVGAVKEDKKRVVGIFYITWHSDGLANLKSPYQGDVSKVLEQYPEARLDANHPAWTEPRLSGFCLHS